MIKGWWRTLKHKIEEGSTCDLPSAHGTVRDSDTWTPEVQAEAARVFTRLALEARQERLDNSPNSC
jgi:hypothetical protein